MNLFVANISKSVNDDALQALFAEFGEVKSVKIITDRYTGEPKGFGFVEMATDKQGQDAIQRLTNADFFGSRLVVSKARAKVSTGY